MNVFSCEVCFFPTTTFTLTSFNFSIPTTVHTHSTCPLAPTKSSSSYFCFPPKENSDQIKFHRRYLSPCFWFRFLLHSLFSISNSFFFFFLLSIVLPFFFFRISSPSRASTTSSQVLLFPLFLSSSHLNFHHSSFSFNSCN